MKTLTDSKIIIEVCELSREINEDTGVSDSLLIYYLFRFSMMDNSNE